MLSWFQWSLLFVLFLFGDGWIFLSFDSIIHLEIIRTDDDHDSDEIDNKQIIFQNKKKLPIFLLLCKEPYLFSTPFFSSKVLCLRVFFLSFTSFQNVWINDHLGDIFVFLVFIFVVFILFGFDWPWSISSSLFIQQNCYSFMKIIVYCLFVIPEFVYVLIIMIIKIKITINLYGVLFQHQYLHFPWIFAFDLIEWND